MRATFTEVDHPELGERFSYIGAPMFPNEVSWRTGPRAPLIGEHNEAVYGDGLGMSQDELVALRARKIV
jgi:crotonobetainyl-CoA:carnitine CoA-transferase CaiB-like acyl-CoA transferase